MAALAGTSVPTGDSTSLAYLRNEVERAGLTAVGFSLGVRRLLVKKLIESLTDSNYNGKPFEAAKLTEQGWNWIDKNEDKFLFRREKKVTQTTDEDFADDIPF